MNTEGNSKILNTPKIPKNITVHLGAPNANAPNVTVPFIDYIANVASSEVYPTWDENALRANIYAQISFALNRIYTEYYPSRGYAFDITNDTSIDQSFVNGRSIYNNIRQIVGEIFNSYIRRKGNIEPLFAQYCDGIEVECNGLSQWGSLNLANEGLSAFEILKYYYGDDIELVENVEVEDISPSLPKVDLKIGSVGDPVRTIQIRLNRISGNYPSIPKTEKIDGVFTNDTDISARTFQEIFGLTVDGIVGKNTWYTIEQVYSAIKRLNELDSEGIKLDEITKQFPGVLAYGSRGIGVNNLQFFLNYLSAFYDTIPKIKIDGIFGEKTKQAVISAQRQFGLVEDGIVGELTWNAIYNAYLGIVNTIPLIYVEGNVLPYPGNVLRVGSNSDEVLLLQEYIDAISKVYFDVPSVNKTGYFGNETESAVMALQKIAGLNPTGVVEATTWNAITSIYSDIYNASRINDGQYVGYEIGG